MTSPSSSRSARPSAASVPGLLKQLWRKRRGLLPVSAVFIGVVGVGAGIAAALMSGHSASAVTPGFTAYVDSTSDGAFGTVQTTANVPSGGSATIEIEVQNIPAPGLVGYDVAFSWSPSANLTLVASGLVDVSGLGLIARSIKLTHAHTTQANRGHRQLA